MNYSRSTFSEEHVEHCYALNIVEVSVIYGLANLYQLTFRNDRIVEYQKINMSQSSLKTYIQVNVGHVQTYKLDEPRRIYFMRSSSKTDNEMEVHYYMHITQNCGKNARLKDYGLLRLTHENRMLLVYRQSTSVSGILGDIRDFKLTPEAVVLDIWWPQQMFLVIQQGGSICAEQVHYRIVSVPISPPLLSKSCSFKVVFYSH